MNALMSKREVAKLLAVSVRTIERLVARGKLKTVKVGGCVRFRSNEIKEVVNGERQL